MSRRQRDQRPSPGDRLFRALLRLFPRDFADDYGAEMTDLFRRQRDDAADRGGRRRLFTLWLRTTFDLLRTAPARHWDLLRGDLRVAVRGLRRAPTFTLAAVLTLALGIGANTALFAVVDGVLLRPLPYPQADRLVRLWSLDAERGVRSGVSLQDLGDWRRGTSTFSGIAAWNQGSGNLTGPGEALRVDYALVSAGFFDLLGVAPALGRAFTAAEDGPGRGEVAVVSHGFWRRHLGGERRLGDRVVVLDGRPLTVVGVMPEGFAFPSSEVVLWKPFGMAADAAGARDGRWVQALGRLAPEASVETARGELAGVAARLADAYPETNEGWGVEVRSLHETVVDGARRGLLLLWGVVVLVLLVAAVNLASLLAARNAERRPELAMRTVLGALPGRLVRLMLTESLLLAVAGSLLGNGIAVVAVRLLPRLAPEIPRVATLAVDGRVLGFAAGVAVLTALLVGVLPARRAYREAAGRLSGSRVAGRPGGRTGRRPWRTVVAVEVAATLVVVFLAGLAVRSLDALLTVDPGFPTEALLTLRVEPPSRVETDGDLQDVLRSFRVDRARAAAFYGRLLERVEGLPGVRSAAAVNRRPLGSSGAWTTQLFLPGDSADARRAPVLWRPVAGDYLDTLGTPLLSGRPLRPEDRADSVPVAVISASLARAYWPGEEPLGRRFTHDDPAFSEAIWYTVVGVVEDARYNALAEPPAPVAFVPMEQARFGFFQDWGMDLLVRTEGDPASVAATVRRQVAALDPELPAFAVSTFDQIITEQAAGQRLTAAVTGSFGVLAVLLTAAGVFGVLSYLVASRRREIGVRMALGARRRHVLARVLRDGLTAAALGAVVGAAAALAVGQLVGSSLYGVEPGDPRTLAAVVVLVLLVAALACALPAARAAGTDPLEVLRGP